MKLILGVGAELVRHVVGSGVRLVGERICRLGDRIRNPEPIYAEAFVEAPPGDDGPLTPAALELVAPPREADRATAGKPPASGSVADRGARAGRKWAL